MVQALGLEKSPEAPQ